MLIPCFVLRSRVWHQNNREKTSTMARFIVQDILRLPLSSFIGRRLCLFLVFVISGFLHATIDLSGGIPWHDSGAVRFFCTQALGIWIEEIAAALYGWMIKVWGSKKSTSHWIRLLGHVWVVLFLAWSWPAYMYPMLYRVREGSEDSFLPFSIVRMLF